MNIIRAETIHVSELLNLYKKAIEKMIASGNPNQWNDGYPSRQIIEEDIQAQTLFVCIEGNRIIGCFVLASGLEPSYSVIFNGKWLNEKPYCVIHRFAVLEHGRGVGSKLMKWCLAKCNNIRVDTHEKNTAMRALLEKCGFQYCGIIKLASGDKRLAFQREAAK